MNLFGVFDHRFRGFRVVEIGGVCVALALALVVYLAKTSAGTEGADTDRVQQQIVDEKSKIALLRAEVANLEQPERLETLSNRYLNLQPVAADHQIDAQALADIAHPQPPKPAAPAAATSATVRADAPEAAKTNAAPVVPVDQVAQPLPDTTADSAAAPLQPADVHP
jgi:hypothetical protein